MSGSVRSSQVLRSVILAGVLVVAGGCATTSPQPGSQAQGSTASADAPATYQDETPMSDSRLVESANFDTNAVKEGFKPEIRNGETVYCWSDSDIGTRIPTRKCVNRAELEIMLQRRQQQKDAMQQGGGGCSPGVNCGR